MSQSRKAYHDPDAHTRYRGNGQCVDCEEIARRLKSDRLRHPCPRCGQEAGGTLLCRPCSVTRYHMARYEREMLASLPKGPTPPSEHGPARTLTREEIKRIYGK